MAAAAQVLRAEVLQTVGGASARVLRAEVIQSSLSGRRAQVLRAELINTASTSTRRAVVLRAELLSLRLGPYVWDAGLGQWIPTATYVWFSSDSTWHAF